MASLKKENETNVSPVTQLPTDKDDSETKNDGFSKRNVIEAIIIAAVLIVILLFIGTFFGKFFSEGFQLAKEIAFGNDNNCVIGDTISK